jgi:hypothetical protein
MLRWLQSSAVAAALLAGSLGAPLSSQGWVIGAPPAAAQARPVPSRSELEAKIEKLKTDLTEKRYSALAADIPPKLLSLIATRAGVDTATLSKLIEAQMQKVFEQASIDSFSVTSSDIKTLPSGAYYALLPSVVHMTAQGKKAVSNGHVLAIHDDGKWYLTRVAEHQWHLFTEAYPDYAGLEIPKEKLEFAK